METTRAERHESTDLEQRDVRALTEYMTVLALGGDMYSVTTESGREYRVDARDDRCTCPDYQYQEARCKHSRRVAFATGQRPIPAWVDTDEVDAHLGQHVEETPMVTATDGGNTFSDSGVDDCDYTRPEDCGCIPSMDDLPCWPCFRDGFESPNPNATEGDE